MSMRRTFAALCTVALVGCNSSGTSQETLYMPVSPNQVKDMPQQPLTLLYSHFREKIPTQSPLDCMEKALALQSGGMIGGMMAMNGQTSCVDQDGKEVLSTQHGKVYVPVAKTPSRS